MTHFWWVRHGPTHEKAFVGWRDVPADLGDTAAIARTSQYLPDDAFVGASDLMRASATADAIAGARRRLPDDPALREFDFGDWDGLTFDAVAQRDPEDSRLYWEDPGSRKAPNGESWDDVALRVGDKVDHLVATHPDQHIVIVAHIGVIMTQIQRAARSTAYAAMGHHIDNFSVTDMQVRNGVWTLGTINHIA